MPKLQEAINFLHVNEADIDLLSKKYFVETGNFHDARFDTTATYLLVTEGIKKGHIPRNYFSKIVENV